MLEILLIWSLGKKIGAMASDKGRSYGGFVALFVIAWFGGEFAGAVFGTILNRGEFSAIVYLFALLGAAVGAGAVFILVSLLPSVEDEDYDRPRRKRRRRERDEDEYDGERRSRRPAYDDDDSYRTKFRSKRADADQSDDDDADTGYRRKRRHSDE